MAQTFDGGQEWRLLVATSYSESGYLARCLGVPGLVTHGATMLEAVGELSEVLVEKFAKDRPDLGTPDRSELWQPLPVEMIAPLDIVVVD
ncbi:type II toxin-antitoxin system HicB family antitoxin [Granulicoccus phenolivorans]|uniref:type II toxin-antitoxin system HicB family antitoxin n=1 Tax=Granulicoccus phenolivorans TaxID=266854 RepID=UPI0004258860|nr:hypothetical protein [Granulicoccus phenolivorans]